MILLVKAIKTGRRGRERMVTANPETAVKIRNALIFLKMGPMSSSPTNWQSF